jgi:hypothetical protein
VSPFRPFFPPELSVFPRSIDFYHPLFSCSYKSLFPQPLSFHIHTKPRGGVGWSTPILPPDSLQTFPGSNAISDPERHCGTCKRATAPSNKYLWNEHLQKCVKTKDFNYLQNEHLRKTRGEGRRVSQRPLVFVGGTASTYPMLALAASHALRLLRDAPARYILGASLTTRFP